MRKLLGPDGACQANSLELVVRSDQVKIVNPILVLVTHWYGMEGLGWAFVPKTLE